MQEQDRCRTYIGILSLNRKTNQQQSHRINQAETIKWYKNRFEGIVR